MMRIVIIPALFVIFLFKLSSCGGVGQEEDYIAKNAPGCALSKNGIPCGDIYSNDLLMVHKHATVDALRDYLIAKKNIKKSSTFRKVDDGIGDMQDLLRGINLVKKAYGINPIFVLALSAMESGWGTSCIARRRNNLWGWNAVDGRPCWRVTKFKSYTDGFNIVFPRLKEWYLRTNGKYHRQCQPLEHFDRYVRRGGCSARHCGTTLAGMNCKYSSDPRWAFNIRTQMNHIARFINERCKIIPPFDEIRFPQPERVFLPPGDLGFMSRQQICSLVVQ